MRASKEFSEHDAWIATPRQTHQPAANRTSSLLPLIIAAVALGAVVLLWIIK